MPAASCPFPYHSIRHVTAQIGLLKGAEAGSQRQQEMLVDVRSGSIVLQKSKVAAVQIFGENLKRKEVDDSHSLSRATEVAHEFGAR